MGRSSRPLDKAGARPPKKVFGQFGPPFGLKIRGDPVPPEPPLDLASDQEEISVDMQRPKPALGHAASHHHLPFLAPPTIILLRTPLSTSNIQDATYAISGPNLKDFKQIKSLHYHFV